MSKRNRRKGIVATTDLTGLAAYARPYSEGRISRQVARWDRDLYDYTYAGVPEEQQRGEHVLFTYGIFRHRETLEGTLGHPFHGTYRPAHVEGALRLDSSPAFCVRREWATGEMAARGYVVNNLNMRGIRKMDQVEGTDHDWYRRERMVATHDDAEGGQCEVWMYLASPNTERGMVGRYPGLFRLADRATGEDPEEDVATVEARRVLIEELPAPAIYASAARYVPTRTEVEEYAEGLPEEERAEMRAAIARLFGELEDRDDAQWGPTWKEDDEGHCVHCGRPVSYDDLVDIGDTHGCIFCIETLV